MSAVSATTTLVIDDETVVRHLVRRMLEPEVCRVVEAGDGETGLRLIEHERDAIDVVLTDLLMPGIDGYDVVEVLRTHHPELPVACMSGFASHTSVGRRILAPFISKPFDVEALRALLQPLIAQARALRAAAADDQECVAGEIHHAQQLLRRTDANRDEAIDLVSAARELRRQRAGGPPKG